MRASILMAALTACSAIASADVVITLDELTHESGNYTANQTFSSNGVQFNNTSAPYFWAGFAYSSVNDTTTTGWQNQYSSSTGTGVGGSGNYGVGYIDFFNNVYPTITLPIPTSVSGLYIANTTRAHLVMRDGDPDFGVQPFDANDWFKLIVTARGEDNQVIGTLDHNLATGTTIPNTWQWLNFAGFGDQVKSLSFNVDSSDIGAWGMNTPSYFAMDNLTVAAVPEPAVLGTAVMGASVALIRRRRAK